MSSSIEHLPHELWFMIFSFLEGHDLHRAFSHLNSIIDGLLRSPYLRVHLNVKTGGSKELNLSSIPFCYQALETLYANIYGTSDLLIFLDGALTLSNLRSLSLHIRRQKNYRLLISILPRLPCLEHLAVSYGMCSADNTVQALYSEILKLPQLRKCELRFSPNAFNLSSFYPMLSINSSLRYFYINGWIPSASLCHLVQSMPSLRFLHVYVYHRNEDFWNNLSLPQLSKRTCMSLVRQHIDLNKLTKAAPNLKYFYVRIEPYDGPFTEDFFMMYGLIRSKIDHLHVQMTLKKTVNSDMLDLIPSVTIQGRKCSKGTRDMAWNLKEYDIIAEYSNFI